jgi:Fe-S-cluster containining protein
MTLQEHVRRYLDLALRADDLFRAVQRAHGHLMPCKPGCDDCCSVYFELTILEAFFVANMFRHQLSVDSQRRVLARAKEVEPLFSHANSLLVSMARGAPRRQTDVLEVASSLTIRCPLNEDSSCLLYEHRPITCRLYGTPQSIDRRVVSCPRTGFRRGESYRVVNVNEIQHTLYQYSCDFLQDLVGVAPSAPPGPRFSVPVTLKTTFDREFFISLGQRVEAQKQAETAVE